MDLKLEHINSDNDSTNVKKKTFIIIRNSYVSFFQNLRELLELKERELNALKEKLDYTVQAHQLELQEAIKANQVGL